MRMMSDKTFNKFLEFLASNLENPDLLVLVRKRYNECDVKFRDSTEFTSLVDDVQSKMEKEKHRICVHLKDFLSHLKSYRVDANDKKRKRGGFANNVAKRLCPGNSCSDASSDSDFFKKIKRNINTQIPLKSDLPLTKSDSPNDNDASDSASSSAIKKTDKNSKAAMGHSKDEPFPISDEESSLDSVRSDTKSSDSSDKPLHLRTQFAQEPESVSVDSVSSESKSCQLTSFPNTSNKRSLNTETNASLPNHSTLKKNNDELFDGHASEMVSEPHVVIDNDDSCTVQSLPSKTLVENDNEPEQASDSEKGNTVETDDAESTKGQKKKKGSERQIKRLEKLLGDIHNEIENTTKKEMSLEEMENDDTDYMYEDRLKKKFVKVWEKLCELKGQDTSTGRPIEKKFRFQGTRYTEINRRIEKFVNKKKIFPDYNDIKKIVNQVNTHYKLYLGKSAIEDLAREAFTDVGNKLQDRRHRNFILTFGNSQTEVSSIAEDPALSNLELRKKLQENRKLAKSRLDEVVSKYARKQYETNAQPEEVDENAPDSSSEEEEEAQDIPELDEVMALSDGDEDEVSEIPEKSSAKLDTSFTKNLKVQLEKLVVPPNLLVKKQASVSSANVSSNSPTETCSQNVNSSKAVSIRTASQKLLSSQSESQLNVPKAKTREGVDTNQDDKAASNEIVIDLDSSSDADDSIEVVRSVKPAVQQALVPYRTPFSMNRDNSSNRTRVGPSLSSISSTSCTSTSSNTMMMSSQNGMQFSMQVKTQYQQQQKQDGFSLKIASVTSLAYSIKDANHSTDYFTSKHTSVQNQGFHLTPGSTYKKNSRRPKVTNPSSNVIVLSDSD